MKCPNCGGSGRIINCFGNDEQCKKCSGSGDIKATHEEFIRYFADTEELEHELTMLIMKDRFFADKKFAYVNIRFKVHCWLKENKE